MRDAEAEEVLDRLIAPYPGPPWPENAVEAWVKAIARSSATFEHALDVADKWGEHDDRPPSLARFLAVVAPVRQDVYVATADEWHPDPRIALGLARAWRQALADVAHRRVEADAGHGRLGFDGHWHGGPRPCLLCGGVDPRKVYPSNPATPQPEELYA